MTDSTHSAEKPALYLNHLWTGKPIFGTNVEDFEREGCGSVFEGKRGVCTWRVAIIHSLYQIPKTGRGEYISALRSPADGEKKESAYGIET
jgi:hypothetical protein